MPIIFVSPSGSGAQDGSSILDAMPFRSLNSAVAEAGPGGKVALLSDQGSYEASKPLLLWNGGSDDAPVTITGIDSSGAPARPMIEGTRPADYAPENDSGNEIFRLMNGADNLVFRDMEFRNVSTAFRVGADVSNITIEDMAADNVRRFFENYRSGANETATVSGLTIRDVEVHGFSRGVVRLRYDSNDILIENVMGDSERQDGDNFAIGVHLEDTVHDVVLRRVTMENAQASSDTYWNGDGFATERGVYDVLFDQTVARGNTDGGYDLKSTATTLIDTVAEGNGRNYRFWGDVVAQDIIGLDPRHYGGTVGGQKQVQILEGANVTIDGATFVDSGSDTTVFTNEAGSVSISLSNISVLHAEEGEIIEGEVFPGLNEARIFVRPSTGLYSVDSRPGDIDSYASAPGNRPLLELAEHVTSYGGAKQDVIAHIEKYATGSLELAGNSWKKLLIDYDVTDRTMLSFSFRSSEEGEIQGIGFDNDLVVSNSQLLQLYGIDDWGIRDFEYTGDGEWQEFLIPLGDYVDGAIKYLTFANDDDTHARGAMAFADLRLFEADPAVPPTGTGNVERALVDLTDGLMTYGALKQDRLVTEEAAGEGSLQLAGNSWKRALIDYDVTDHTMLSFSFRSTAGGEIEGIGFANDMQLSKQQLFQLSGQQDWGMRDFGYAGDGEWQEFLIPLGDYVEGVVKYLTFASDDDVNAAAAIEFADLRIFEAQSAVVAENSADSSPSLVDLTHNLISYGGTKQDVVTTVEMAGPGSLELAGNSWKRVFIDYEVTDQTILSFSFRSTAEGEVQGIGFTDDGKLANDHLFQLFGTQDWGLRDFDYTGDGEWQEFLIPLGDYVEGRVKYLSFANDDDKDASGAVEFADLRIFERDDIVDDAPALAGADFILSDVGMLGLETALIL